MFILHKVARPLIPVDNYSFITFAAVIFVYDPAKL
jgi:hypothetical protein